MQINQQRKGLTADLMGKLNTSFSILTACVSGRQLLKITVETFYRNHCTTVGRKRVLSVVTEITKAECFSYLGLITVCERLCINIPSPSLNLLRRMWETGGWWDWGRGSFQHWRPSQDQERTEPANTTHVCIYTVVVLVQTCTAPQTRPQTENFSRTAQERGLTRQIIWNHMSDLMLLTGKNREGMWQQVWKLAVIRCKMWIL